VALYAVTMKHMGKKFFYSKPHHGARLRTRRPGLTDDKCEWEWGDCYWDTGCGRAFEFNDGTPTDNDFRYCPYCGKELVESGYVEED